MRKLAVLTLSALVLSACLGSDFQDSLEAGWEMTSGNVGGQPIEPPDSHPITISFAGNVVGGTASCNSYGGEYRTSGSALTFGDLFITEMACQPQEAMDAESLFMQALALVETVELGNGTLTLRGPATELDFAILPPVPKAEMLNTVWVLDGLISGDAVSSVGGERATLEFFTDGSLLGSTGCRSLAGQYQVNDADVEVTGLSAQGECDPALADQDSHVVSVLEGGIRVEIEGNRMTLMAAGSEGLTYLADE
jgi:heat shock protein HslJ